MLSLKDFKSFEVNDHLKIIGGGQATTHSTYGADEIESDAHGSWMTAENGNIFLGCGCSSGSFATHCCSQQ